MKRIVLTLVLLLAALPACAVPEWGNGRILIQHYNSANCSGITGVDAGDAGSVCWQTTTKKWWDWTGVAWVQRGEGAEGPPGDSALEWINVKEDHGAQGDGVTDDTAALQAAAASLTAKSAGGVLFFPPGNYLLRDRMVMTFSAASRSVIMGHGATLTVDGEIDGAVLSITAADGLEISGLSIVDPDSDAHDDGLTEQTHGIVLNGSTNVFIHHVNIVGMGDECLAIQSSSSNITVRDSQFSDCAEIETSNSSSLGVARSSNVTISDNIFFGVSPDTASAIRVECASPACQADELRDIHITSNQILDPTGVGISIAPADAEVVLSGLQITGNIIRNPGKQGIRLRGESPGARVVRTLISDNTIEGGGATYNVDADGAGIHILLSNGGAADGAGIISDNVVNGWGNPSDTDTHDCITVSSGGWLVDHNQVSNCRRAGIRSASTADAPNILSNNTVDTVVGSGIFAVIADKVVGNDVQNVATGVYYDVGTEEGLVSGNVIASAGTVGIRLNGTDIWAIGNVVSDSTKGITGSGSAPRVTNNVFPGIDPADHYGPGTMPTAMEFGPTLDVAHDVSLLEADVAQPSVAGAVWFRTQNTASALPVTDFADGINGQVIFVHINDDFTVFDFTGTSLKGNSGADWGAQTDEMMVCIRGSSLWYCNVSDPGTGTAWTGSQQAIDSLTDETGTGYMVFNENPEIITPTLSLSQVAPGTNEGRLAYDTVANTLLVGDAASGQISFYPVCPTGQVRDGASCSAGNGSGALARVTSPVLTTPQLNLSVNADPGSTAGRLGYNSTVKKLWVGTSEGSKYVSPDCPAGQSRVGADCTTSGPGSSTWTERQTNTVLQPNTSTIKWLRLKGGADTSVPAIGSDGTAKIAFSFNLGGGGPAPVEDLTLVHSTDLYLWTDVNASDTVWEYDVTGGGESVLLADQFTTPAKTDPSGGLLDADALCSPLDYMYFTTETDAGANADFTMQGCRSSSLSNIFTWDASAAELIVTDSIVGDTVMFLKERAADITDKSGYAQIWAKTDQSLWFTPSTGTPVQLALSLPLPQTECFYVELPVTGEHLSTVMRKTYAITITSLWCETDTGTVAGFNLQRDDGTPVADVGNGDMTCNTTGVTQTTLFVGEKFFGAGDRWDIDIGTVGGGATRVSLCVDFTRD